MEIPILKGERVVLRPLKVKDAENYVRWFSDREVLNYMTQMYYRVSLEEERKYIRSLQRQPVKKQYTFAIVNEEGKHIGGTGLNVKLNKKRIEWGIVIGEKSEWGKGYAGECAKLCLDFAFKKLKANRVELYVSIDNKRAVKAYKKIGFKLEGVLRKAKHNKFKNKYEDMGVMSILQDEWKK